MRQFYCVKCGNKGTTLFGFKVEYCGPDRNSRKIVGHCVRGGFLWHKKWEVRCEAEPEEHWHCTCDECKYCWIDVFEDMPEQNTNATEQAES